MQTVKIECKYKVDFSAFKSNPRKRCNVQYNHTIEQAERDMIPPNKAMRIINSLIKDLRAAGALKDTVSDEELMVSSSFMELCKKRADDKAIDKFNCG